jgi:hypothetical protein
MTYVSNDAYTLNKGDKMNEFKLALGCILFLIGFVIAIGLGIDRFTYFDHLTQPQFVKQNWEALAVMVACNISGAFLVASSERVN